MSTLACYRQLTIQLPVRLLLAQNHLRLRDKSGSSSSRHPYKRVPLALEPPHHLILKSLTISRVSTVTCGEIA
jgi:hypothetical protein